MLEIAGAVVVLLFAGLVIFGFYKIAETIILIIIGLFTYHHQSKNIRLTNLHYFDHPDRYFDYHTNQWHFKETN